MLPADSDGLRFAIAAPELAPELLEMMRDFNHGEEIDVEAARLAPALDRLLREPELGRVLVARRGAALLGYAVLTYGYDLEWAGRDAFLTELYLKPEHRRQGIGDALLSAVESLAQAEGCSALHLMVRPENAAAVKLYAAHGYTQPPRLFLTKAFAPA